MSQQTLACSMVFSRMTDRADRRLKNGRCSRMKLHSYVKWIWIRLGDGFWRILLEFLSSSESLLSHSCKAKLEVSLSISMALEASQTRTRSH
jgi:hypothetical protein